MLAERRVAHSLPATGGRGQLLRPRRRQPDRVSKEGFNVGGTYSCSKESHRCPSKSVPGYDVTPSAPCGDGDTSKSVQRRLPGPQFEPVGGYPGKYARKASTPTDSVRLAQSSSAPPTYHPPTPISPPSHPSPPPPHTPPPPLFSPFPNPSTYRGACAACRQQPGEPGGEHQFVIVDQVQVPKDLPPV